ncbi:MEDS domain-containing protein [Actinomadura formosensis]|uniref:MEDS domain-containing protein n=1 Tax=Actinomadura formosensis TaxID=60706 RepID=UPI000835F5B9|nr:MEDS domain-containing protein [Actinomadura formosensis]
MGTSWVAERSVGAILPGDHGWLAYSGPEERGRVIGPFVHEGLLTGEKVVYVTDTPAGRLPGLGHRIDVHDHLRAGRLRVISREDACLDRSGAFEPARMLDTVEREIGEAFGQGFRAVRLTTDYTWLLDEPGRMLGCEHRLGGAVAPSTMAMAICQIDRRACPPDQLIALRDLHEVLVEVDPEFDDGVLRMVRTFAPAGLRLEGELDATRHGAVAARLAQVMARHGGVHLDLSRLGFIDLGGLDLLARLAARLPAGGTLVLDHLRPSVLSVIETVGWHRLPGLVRGAGRGLPETEGIAR